MFGKFKSFFGNVIFIQIILLSFNWILAGSMTLLFINLVKVSYEVNDHQTASILISILAIVVFWVLSAILTYVLIGLNKGKKAESLK